MAALLQMFQPVPPVVRRRAKELLEAIRACLQRYFSKSKNEAPVLPAVEKDAEMQVDEVVAKVELPTSSAGNLWSIGALFARVSAFNQPYSVPGTSTLAGKSALFGVSLAAKTPAIALATSTSSLFGTKGTAAMQVT
jgi:exosome complex exonuclease RRP6